MYQFYNTSSKAREFIIFTKTHLHRWIFFKYIQFPDECGDYKINFIFFFKLSIIYNMIFAINSFLPTIKSQCKNKIRNFSFSDNLYGVSVPLKANSKKKQPTWITEQQSRQTYDCEEQGEKRISQTGQSQQASLRLRHLLSHIHTHALSISIPPSSI